MKWTRKIYLYWYCITLNFLVILIKFCNLNGDILNFFPYSFFCNQVYIQIKVLHFVNYLSFKPTNIMVVNFGNVPLMQSLHSWVSMTMFDTYIFKRSFCHVKCKDNWCEWDNIVIILTCYVGKKWILCHFITSMKTILRWFV